MCAAVRLQRVAAAVPSRSFAAGGKPAIQLFGVSGRYATALYAAAGSQVAAVEAELKTISAARKSNPKFEMFISDPTLSNSMKTDTLKAIMTKGGYSDTTAKFLSANNHALRLPQPLRSLFYRKQSHLGLTFVSRRVLLRPDLVVENRRLNDLEKITKDLSKLTAADRSELSAIVKTAVKLTPKQEKALQKALTAHPDVGAGNSLTMSNVVDANIIGGIVVEVEDGGVTRVIDLSAKKKLSQLKQLLAA